MSRYLARAIAGFVGVVLLASILPIALLSSRLARVELRERADRVAGVLAAAITAIGPDAAARTIEQLPVDPDARTLVIAADGTVVADSEPDAPRPAVPPLATVLRGGRLADAAGGGVRAAAPVADPAGEIAGMVVVQLSADSVSERTRAVGVLLAGIGAVVIAAAAGFGALLARSLVRPVEQLDEGAQGLAAGDLSARVTVPDEPEELRRLAQSFNEMAARLDAVVATQRAFTSDAAHQLRTPMTVLRLRLESLEDRAPDDPDVQVAVAQTTRLQSLVEDLLALARLERGQAATGHVDLGSAVRAHCALWTALADEHGIGLRHRDGGDGPVVVAVTGAVEQVLDNYLENALRVAPPGSEITVTVAREDDHGVVRVADRGPGLEPEDRRRAFDRFWRSDGARRDGGTGLGLAIVARLVAASGGTARLDARPGGGTVALATFPVAGEADDGAPARSRA